MFIELFALSIALTGGLSRKAPAFIHPCDSTDPACLIPASNAAIKPFAEGIPELGIPTLDPFKVDEINVPENDFNIKFSDGIVRGLKSCVIDDMKSDLVKRFFVFDFHCHLNIEGKYKTEGKFLEFIISGDGIIKIDFEKIKMRLEINTEYTKDKEGANHFSIKDYKYTFDYGEKAKFVLEDFKPENKELTANVETILNKEWKNLVNQFGKPYLDYGVQSGIKHASKFFKEVPYEELINVPIPN